MFCFVFVFNLKTMEHRIIIQSDWNKALREKNGTAWVVYKQTGQKGVHGELKTTCKETGHLSITGTEGFYVENISENSITVRYSNEGCELTSRFLAPDVSYHSIHEAKEHIQCLDVTPGGLAVSSDTHANLKIWTSGDGEVRRKLDGHYGDVYTCRFFPSGVVILSGGADTLLRVWSAETGQCAATFKGHRAGVTDTAIVERGRNVMSVSRDGSAKLWDCGTSGCLATFNVEAGMINGCALGAPTAVELGSPAEPPGDKEVLTGGKLLVVACELGQLEGHAVQSRNKIFSCKFSDAVNCCAFVSDNTVVCGTQNSQLHYVDIRRPDVPQMTRHESRSSILSLLPWQSGVIVTTGDGSCFCLDQNYSNVLELTGADCDPVPKVVTDSKSVYTCCRDGVIRRYSETR